MRADKRAMMTLSDLAPDYDAILSDVWGVVHNGVVAHAEAVEALRRFRQAGGRVVLITNAPRAVAPIVDMLDRLHVPRDAYDAVITSGEVTRAMIAPYRGKIIHHIGPPTIDDSIYDGLGVIRGPAEEAEAVVVTDLDTDDDTPDMYEARIAVWLRRKLPLICANPDRVVEHGGRIIYCGGALADLYEAHGGRIRMAGKPYRQIYDEALRLADTAAGRPLERSRILAIGDSVRTDAIGAANAGLDLLFITGSIHAQELDAFGSPDPEAVRDLVAPSGARLKGFMPRLAW
jgi:HAD superfamily hydrolase (TIGR01459 family)